MTNTEMMRADMLDILFQNRNKSYGAYTLRREYDKRLTTALVVGISLLVLLIGLTRLGSKSENAVIASNKEELIIKEYDIPKKKEKQPEKPKEIDKPKAKPQVAKQPQVATVKSTTLVVKPDAIVKDVVTKNDDMLDKQIGTTNTPGKKDDGTVKQPIVPDLGTDGGGTAKKEPEPEKQTVFEIQEKDPEFPGGKEAFMRFMSKNLNTPDELEAGETKTVRVKFKVDKDGTVNGFEIVSSAGNEFDKEVIRVCKKMPNWKPAIQNGVNVAVHFVIPVTFMGLGE